jgi:cell division protein FtsL
MVKVLIVAALIAIARMLYIKYEHEVQAKLYDLNTKYFSKKKKRK